MITRRQIRAGLALLDMTVQQFVKEGGVPAQTTINRYLRDSKADMRAGNLQKIQAKFEELGVTFTENEGVKLK